MLNEVVRKLLASPVHFGILRYHGVAWNFEEQPSATLTAATPQLPVPLVDLVRVACGVDEVLLLCVGTLRPLCLKHHRHGRKSVVHCPKNVIGVSVGLDPKIRMPSKAVSLACLTSCQLKYKAESEPRHAGTCWLRSCPLVFPCHFIRSKMLPQSG